MKKDSKTLKFSVFSNENESLPEFVEKQYSGKKWLNYGKDNKLPFYLYDCYEKSALMNSIINTTVDFILGNGVQSSLETVNSKGDTIEDFIRDIAFDYMLFKGFAFQIIYNKLGQVSELYWLDFRKCRVNEELTTVFYSKEFNTKPNPQFIEFPIWKEDDTNKKGSKVFYYNGTKRTVYPIPKYSGSLAAIQTNIEIQKFHLNAIRNNFSSNFMINFNSGEPTEDVKKTIERELKEKFCGSENAGKFMVAFNDNKDSAVTIARIPEDQFDKKYDALNKSTTQAIFTGFSAPQQLFGGLVEGSLFNKQEYEEAFNLYNRLQVQPVQMIIKRSLESVYEIPEIIEFKPFELNPDENDKNITPITNE